MQESDNPSHRDPAESGSLIAPALGPYPPDSDQASIATSVEIDNIESDSAYGEEISIYTASITSSVTDFPEIHGRTYHAYRMGRYSLPNDDKENERLDIHHALIYKAMGGRLYFAPINPNLQRAIDIATGTGIWAIQFADQHQSAEVIGNDLSPTQTTMVPPNLKFIVDDIEGDWGYERQPFDFVHARFLAGAVRDWPRLMQQTFNCTKPGGWAEFQDWNTFIYSHDNSIPPDSAIAKFHAMCGNARESQGFDMKPGKSLEGWMKAAGFQNVHAQKIYLPLGTWPKDRSLKEIGAFNLLQMQEAVEAICLGTLPHAPEPWSYEEIQAFLIQIRQDFRNRKFHGRYDL